MFPFIVLTAHPDLAQTCMGFTDGMYMYELTCYTPGEGFY